MNKLIYTASKDNPYFVYDRDGDGFIYFSNEADRDKHAAECIQQYLQDGWGEGVEDVLTGKVTHTAQQTNRKERPPEDKLDEFQCDEGGTYWDSDFSYICNYELQEL